MNEIDTLPPSARYKPEPLESPRFPWASGGRVEEFAKCRVWMIPYDDGKVHMQIYHFKKGNTIFDEELL